VFSSSLDVHSIFVVALDSSCRDLNTMIHRETLGGEKTSLVGDEKLGFMRKSSEKTRKERRHIGRS